MGQFEIKHKLESNANGRKQEKEFAGIYFDRAGIGCFYCDGFASSEFLGAAFYQNFSLSGE